MNYEPSKHSRLQWVKMYLVAQDVRSAHLNDKLKDHNKHISESFMPR